MTGKKKSEKKENYCFGIHAYCKDPKNPKCPGFDGRVYEDEGKDESCSWH